MDYIVVRDHYVVKAFEEKQRLHDEIYQKNDNISERPEPSVVYPFTGELIPIYTEPPPFPSRFKPFTLDDKARSLYDAIIQQRCRNSFRRKIAFIHRAVDVKISDDSSVETLHSVHQLKNFKEKVNLGSDSSKLIFLNPRWIIKESEAGPIHPLVSHPHLLPIQRQNLFHIPLQLPQAPICDSTLFFDVNGDMPKGIRLHSGQALSNNSMLPKINFIDSESRVISSALDFALPPPNDDSNNMQPADFDKYLHDAQVEKLHTPYDPIFTYSSQADDGITARVTSLSIDDDERSEHEDDLSLINHESSHVACRTHAASCSRPDSNQPSYPRPVPAFSPPIPLPLRAPPGVRINMSYIVPFNTTSDSTATPTSIVSTPQTPEESATNSSLIQNPSQQQQQHQQPSVTASSLNNAKPFLMSSSGSKRGLLSRHTSGGKISPSSIPLPTPAVSAPQKMTSQHTSAYSVCGSVPKSINPRSRQSANSAYDHIRTFRVTTIKSNQHSSTHQSCNTVEPPSHLDSRTSRNPKSFNFPHSKVTCQTLGLCRGTKLQVALKLKEIAPLASWYSAEITETQNEKLLPCPAESATFFRVTVWAYEFRPEPDEQQENSMNGKNKFGGGKGKCWEKRGIPSHVDFLPCSISVSLSVCMMFDDRLPPLALPEHSWRFFPAPWHDLAAGDLINVRMEEFCRESADAIVLYVYASNLRDISAGVREAQILFLGDMKSERINVDYFVNGKISSVCAEIITNGEELSGLKDEIFLSKQPVFVWKSLQADRFGQYFSYIPFVPFSKQGWSDENWIENEVSSVAASFIKLLPFRSVMRPLHWSKDKQITSNYVDSIRDTDVYFQYKECLPVRQIRLSRNNNLPSNQHTQKVLDNSNITTKNCESGETSSYMERENAPEQNENPSNNINKLKSQTKKLKSIRHTVNDNQTNRHSTSMTRRTIAKQNNCESDSTTSSLSSPRNNNNNTDGVVDGNQMSNSNHNEEKNLILDDDDIVLLTTSTSHLKSGQMDNTIDDDPKHLRYNAILNSNPSLLISNRKTIFSPINNISNSSQELGPPFNSQDSINGVRSTSHQNFNPIESNLLDHRPDIHQNLPCPLLHPNIFAQTPAFNSSPPTRSKIMSSLLNEEDIHTRTNFDLPIFSGSPSKNQVDILSHFESHHAQINADRIPDLPPLVSDSSLADETKRGPSNQSCSANPDIINPPKLSLEMELGALTILPLSCEMIEATTIDCTPQVSSKKTEAKSFSSCLTKNGEKQVLITANTSAQTNKINVSTSVSSKAAVSVAEDELGHRVRDKTLSSVDQMSVVNVVEKKPTDYVGVSTFPEHFLSSQKPPAAHTVQKSHNEESSNTQTITFNTNNENQSSDNSSNGKEAKGMSQHLSKTPGTGYKTNPRQNIWLTKGRHSTENKASLENKAITGTDIFSHSTPPSIDVPDLQKKKI